MTSRIHFSRRQSMKFQNKILIVGCGSVSRCTIPLVISYLKLSPHQITVIDMIDYSDKIPPGIRYIVKELTPDNYQVVLAEHLHQGDLFIDLAWNLSTVDMLSWCKAHGVRFINTALELWNPFADTKGNGEEKTLYYRHMHLRDTIKSWNHEKGPTAVLDHGANPGLISSLAKQGIVDIAHAIDRTLAPGPRKSQIHEALAQNNFSKLAYIIGLKTIHISERDTQKRQAPKQENEFVNTWSVVGFYEEGIAPSELGWGTHETKKPLGAFSHASGPQNQIFLSSKGIDTWVESWVPGGPFTGMAVRHGESFTLSDFLTYRENGQAIYRPTVHYAYHPCDAAVSSLEELRKNKYQLQNLLSISDEDLIEGEDALGCLLMGHDLGVWWTGISLDIHASRRLVPHQNATTVQVAAGILAAILYCLKHPDEGVCLPERLPHEFVLEVAKPYMGDFISRPTNWRPSKQGGDKNNWQFDVFRTNEPSKLNSLSPIANKNV